LKTPKFIAWQGLSNKPNLKKFRRVGLGGFPCQLQRSGAPYGGAAGGSSAARSSAAHSSISLTLVEREM